MSQSTLKLNWGLLGTGNIARTFAKGLADSQTGKLVAVGSRTSESAEKFGAEFDVPHRHGSYDALLADPDVQAVYISTPHPMHAEWAIRTAHAGKHVLCEKPLTMNFPEAMAVVEAAIENKVLLMEAFMYRCHPQTTKIVELIQSGAIGQVRIIAATFSFNGGWKPDSRLLNLDLGGGGILDVGCYCASMARLLAGAANGRDFDNPTELKAVGRLGETGADEWTIATLKFPNDILAQLSTGVQLNQESVMRVFGSEGSIFVPSPWFCGPTDGHIKIVLTKNGQAEEIIIETDRSLYAYEADVFAASVEAGKVLSPAMSPDDALGNMQTLDKWRAQIGLKYPSENLATGRPASGRKPSAKADHTMKFARVPGLKPVSRLVLGTMLEGAIDREVQAAALFDDWIERGGNGFDTAYIYGSERIFGDWLQSRAARDDVMIIGKGAHTPYCDPDNLSSQLLQSLERLQVDTIDLYMMHRDNLDIPVGEFVDVLNEHLRAGRITAFGGSNWSTARLDAANEYARQKGLTGFVAASNNFSLARMVEAVWPGTISNSDPASRAWFEKTQMPLFAWSSQARGFFVRGDKTDRSDAELARCWYSDDNFQRLDRVRELAKQRDVLPINIAAAYVLNQPFPTFALIGPRTLSETRTSLPALKIELSPQELRWLNLED